MTREEAIQRLNNIDIREALQEDYEAIDMAIEALSAEAVSRFHHDMEVKELKHQNKDRADAVQGEWIKKQVFNPELDKYIPYIECSVCGYAPYYGGSESKFNYCSNCGARMKGGAE